MNKLILLIIFTFNLSCLSARVNQGIIKQSGDSIEISFKGDLIFKGKVFGYTKAMKINDQSYTIDGRSYEIVTITTGNFSVFELTGQVDASGSSMACESDPRDGGLNVVRHVSGKSHSLLNNAIYDRKSDWLLSFDVVNQKVLIEPEENNQYQVHVQGWEIVIRFRPDYYKKHKGLEYFNPSEYNVWDKPIVGWCSWFAYFNKVTENDIRKTADILSYKLKPFGLEYLQIDDGYQQVPIGMPDTWLNPNNKFPSGLKELSGYIKSKGLKPGIWTNVSFADSAKAYQHSGLFVPNNKNQPAYGNWVSYVMDGSDSHSIEQLIEPVYKGLKDSGWQYFKLDALRHLKYEGYNANNEYFELKKTSKNEAFRNIVKSVRQQTGDENFLLACWGIRPELVGIADGCRIGNDGYSYAGLAQFNSYNNIIWMNDPDHIELSQQEAYRSCTATSLTGSLFMLTDKPEIYEISPLIEAAKRCIPVLFTLPGQVYDVDPSRSSLIHLADAEMSGSGPRCFDAGTTTTTGLFSLEISRPFENWLILGRLDERDPLIPLKDLGLNENKKYLVYEFWSEKFIGIMQKQLIPGNIDTNFNCQVFCFRELKDHPQLIATSRHITCGGTELSNMSWLNSTLSGTSELVAGDLYTIWVYEPEEAVYKGFKAGGDVDVIINNKKGNVRTISMNPVSGGKTNWSIQY